MTHRARVSGAAQGAQCMKIEKMEVVGVNVKNLDLAMKFFSEVLEVEFKDFRFGQDVKVEAAPIEAADTSTLSFDGTRIAIDPKGYLELIQGNPPAEQEGLRNVHFKVPNLDEAKAEMKRKGVRLVADTKVGGLREAIFHPDDVYGIRLCLIEYDAPTMIEALLRKG
jgi:hypothetical protein